MDLHSPGGLKHNSKGMLMLLCAGLVNGLPFANRLVCNDYSLLLLPQVAKDLHYCTFKKACFLVEFPSPVKVPSCNVPTHGLYPVWCQAKPHKQQCNLSTM